MLLKKEIKNAHSDIKQALMARFITMGEDTRRQVGQLYHFPQLMELDTISNAPWVANRWTRDRIGAIREAKPKKQTNCYNFGKNRHIKRGCRIKAFIAMKTSFQEFEAYLQTQNIRSEYEIQIADPAGISSRVSTCYMIAKNEINPVCFQIGRKSSQNGQDRWGSLQQPTICRWMFFRMTCNIEE